LNKLVYKIRLLLTELFFGLALLVAPKEVREHLERLRTVRERKVP